MTEIKQLIKSLNTTNQPVTEEQLSTLSMDDIVMFIRMSGMRNIRAMNSTATEAVQTAIQITINPPVSNPIERALFQVVTGGVKSEKGFTTEIKVMNGDQMISKEEIYQKIVDVANKYRIATSSEIVDLLYYFCGSHVLEIDQELINEYLQ